MHRAFTDAASRAGPRADTVHGGGLWWPQAAPLEGHSRQEGCDSICYGSHGRWAGQVSSAPPPALQSCSENDLGETRHLDTCSSSQPRAHRSHHRDTKPDGPLEQFGRHGASGAAQQAASRGGEGQRGWVGLNGRHGGKAPRLNSYTLVWLQCHSSVIQDGRRAMPQHHIHVLRARTPSFFWLLDVNEFNWTWNPSHHHKNFQHYICQWKKRKAVKYFTYNFNCYESLMVIKMALNFLSLTCANKVSYQGWLPRICRDHPQNSLHQARCKAISTISPGIKRLYSWKEASSSFSSKLGKWFILIQHILSFLIYYILFFML